jgi:hypothetical protein
MIDLNVALIMLAVGILTKFVDFEEHGIRIRKLILYVCGIAYGILIALAVKILPIIAPIIFATVISVVIAGKIDTISHKFGIASFVIFTLIWGIPPLNLIYLAILTFAGALDEYVNDFVGSGTGLPPRIKTVIELRPLLEIAALIVSLITGVIMIWVTIFFYDVGFNLMTFFARKYDVYKP